LPTEALRRWIGAAGVLAALAFALAWKVGESRSGDAPMGLFTTLPIVWSESGDIGDLLRSDAPAHWARGVLEANGSILALDSLAGEGGQRPLAKIERLVMAQPRPLSPAENVALDDWVRGGGELLLFADPMLTEQSAYAVGDRRRPQDVVLLSPILNRWGLGLQFDEAQAMGERPVEVMGGRMPVNLPGRFVLAAGSTNCRAWGDGVAVTCAIGKGRVVALADAAVLEADDPVGERSRALGWLLDAAFAAN
jgi:hypothetical protein